MILLEASSTKVTMGFLHDESSSEDSKNDIDDDSVSDLEEYKDVSDGNTGIDSTEGRRVQPARKAKNRTSQVTHAKSAVINCEITTSDTPSVSSALNATPPEVELWQAAIEDEFKSLEEKGTWVEVGQAETREKSVLPSHIVLKVKRDSDGQPVRFKARVVVGGHHQKKFEHYSVHHI